MQEHSVTAANAIVGMLESAVANPEDALAAIEGAMWIVSVPQGARISAIKTLKAHVIAETLKEAKDLVDECPVQLSRKKLGEFTSTQKMLLAHDLRNLGVEVEFRR